MNKDRYRSFPVVMILVLLVGWEAATRIFDLPVYLLPAPSDAAKAFMRSPVYYLSSGWVTLVEALAGLALGSTFAIAIAIGLYYFPKYENGVMSIAIIIKTMPMVAIAPLLTIWLGFGILPKVIITALMAFFPILINLLVGFQHVAVEWLELAKIIGSSKTQTLFRIHRFAGLTYLFAGFRVAAPLAFIGAVVAEWAGASGGLGRIMWLAYANLNLPPMFAAIFLLSILSATAYYAIVMIEGKVIFWEPL